VSSLTANDKGKIRYNIDIGEIKYYNGAAVVTMGAGGGASLNGISGTGAVQRHADGTYATFAVSSSGKKLIAATNANSQRATLGLDDLATRNSITLVDLPVSPCAEGSVLKIVSGVWACASLTSADFGVTASQTELGYLSGATSNIQTQLSSKLGTSGGDI
jgi:hypothetical protein